MHLNRSTHSRHLKSVRCHRHRSFYPSSQTAQPTQAGTPPPVLSPAPTALVGTFPGAPRGPSVPARAASRLTHSRWSSHPKPKQARRSRLGRGCRKNGVDFQRISQEEAQRAGWGIANQQKNPRPRPLVLARCAKAYGSRVSQVMLG